MHWRIQRGTRDARPLSVQFVSFSCSFRQKYCQIIGFCPKLRNWRSPRLGNPGSATALTWTWLRFDHFTWGGVDIDTDVVWRMNFKNRLDHLHLKTLRQCERFLHAWFIGLFFCIWLLFTFACRRKQPIKIYRVIHKVGNVSIFVYLLMNINWK